MRVIKPCFEKPKLNFNQVWCTLHLTVPHGVSRRHPKILNFDYKNVWLLSHLWSSHKRHVNVKQSTLVATTCNSHWAAHFSKKIYMRILFDFKIFQGIANGNAWTNVCLELKMNMVLLFRKQLDSLQTSNGSALPFAVLVTKDVNMPIFVELTPVV